MSKILIYCYIFILIVILTKVEGSGKSIFEKTFKLLHQQPPPPDVKERSTVITKWIEQKLDNFETLDTRTWKMRYMENRVHFKPGGPIFIYVGGEWTISENSIQGGLIYDMAKEHNGILFYTEHRYYGKSIPLNDLSLKNLEYCNVRQSLADLAHFIATIKMENLDLRYSKVILVGGSYSASMVTWFQRIYPGTAIGSWASSAPLLAKVDFSEYKEVVGQSLSLVGGQICHDKVANAFNEMEKILNTNNSHLIELFNICPNFNPKNKLDIWSFFGSLSDFFAGLVQTHNSGSIENACKKNLFKRK